MSLYGQSLEPLAIMNFYVVFEPLAAQYTIICNHVCGYVCLRLRLFADSSMHMHALILNE